MTVLRLNDTGNGCSEKNAGIRTHHLKETRRPVQLETNLEVRSGVEESGLGDLLRADLGVLRPLGERRQPVGLKPEEVVVRGSRSRRLAFPRAHRDLLQAGETWNNVSNG